MVQFAVRTLTELKPVQIGYESEDLSLLNTHHINEIQTKDMKRERSGIYELQIKVTSESG